MPALATAANASEPMDVGAFHAKKEDIPGQVANTLAPCFRLAKLMWEQGCDARAIGHYTNPPGSGGNGCIAISQFASFYTNGNYESTLEVEVENIAGLAGNEMDDGRLRIC